MDIEFNGKAYLVTGGASGIGAAVVHYLARHGGNVVVADINDEAGQQLVDSFPGQVACHHTDVTDYSALEAACALAAERFGRLDGAVNSAGIGSLGNTLEIPLQDWRKVIDIDLHGVFHACRAALPLMLKNGGGSIVNIASLSGIRADHGFAAYNAAKAGVINYSRTLGLDHAKDNIRANAVCPGLIETGMTKMVFDYAREKGKEAKLGSRCELRRYGRPGRRSRKMVSESAAPSATQALSPADSSSRWTCRVAPATREPPSETRYTVTRTGVGASCAAALGTPKTSPKDKTGVTSLRACFQAGAARAAPLTRLTGRDPRRKGDALSRGGQGLPGRPPRSAIRRPPPAATG